MYRNIILCADGTGNKGGFTPDSNVFKTYNAVDINNRQKTQITYYDNGVGTSTNKFLKAISAGLGVGFQRNVRDLYAFLSKNYNPGKGTDSDALDKVYLFGFSRGAATIRALNGFVHDCGLIDARNYSGDIELKKEVRALIKTYLQARYKKDEETLARLAKGDPINGCKARRNKVSIEFIGVWDTVAALGMPKRTDNTGPVSTALNMLFNGIDSIFDYFLHHRKYNYQLTPNITRACHALAIDDARTSFWPRIWNELSDNASGVDVDQVWFAGMHSDVGGGYKRQDMSNVSLVWILGDAEKHGLKLKTGVLDDIKARANVHDKMHDSRDGLGFFYRYHPRDIETLCRDERDQEKEILKGDTVKIHETVLSRMYYRTAGYAPYLLPGKFAVVNSDVNKITEVDVCHDSDWHKNSQKALVYVNRLKGLYIYQLMFTIFILGVSLYLWNCQVDYYGRSGISGYIANGMQYILPDVFNNSIELGVSQNPFVILLVLGFVMLWWRVREFLRFRLLLRALAKRSIIMAQYTETDEKQ